VRITIAGAGVVGCAIACELARRGASVRVIDPRGAGQGASQASAGILAPVIEGHSEALLRLLRCAMTLYDGFVSRLTEAGAVIEYARAGTLQIAVDEEQARALARAADSLLALRLPYELLSGAETRRTEPAVTPDAVAGLVVHGDGYVVVGALVAGLVRAARALGVEFATNRVVAVHGHGGGVSVEADTHTFDSDAAIVAAGCWQADVIGGGLRPAAVRPIRGQILRLRSSARIAGRVIWGRRCYVVPWQDGSALVGATVEDAGFDERPTAGGVRELLNAGVGLVPSLEGASFEEVRVGLRPMASDELPIIGASSHEPHVFHASGHYRNGVLLSPLTAALVADLVLEGREREELTLTRPGRLGL
jgi:glycine oxidase